MNANKPNSAWVEPSKTASSPENLSFGGGGVPIMGHMGYWATDWDTGKRRWVASTLTEQDKEILRGRQKWGG